MQPESLGIWSKLLAGAREAKDNREENNLAGLHTVKAQKGKKFVSSWSNEERGGYVYRTVYAAFDHYPL